MKKLSVLILTLTICILFAACGGKDTSEKSSDNTASKEQTDNKDSSLESSDNHSSEPESYTLYNDSGDKSILVSVPSNYSATDSLSDTWLNFEAPSSTGNGISQLSIYLLDSNSEEIADTSKREIEYAASANADGDADISDINHVSCTSYDVSYFTYSYSSGSDMTEGCKLWTQLQNGAVFSCTYETIGTDIEAADIDSLIPEIIQALQE